LDILGWEEKTEVGYIGMGERRRRLDILGWEREDGLVGRVERGSEGKGQDPSIQKRYL
jgi:hypothetical protein